MSRQTTVVDEAWRVARDGDTLVLTNPPTQVAVQVAERGRVTLRAPTGTFALQEQAVQLDGAMVPLQVGEPEVGPCVDDDPRRTPDGACVATAETRRSGVRSWWRNEPEGVRQGWTIDGQPGVRELAITVGTEGKPVAVRDGTIEVGSLGRGIAGRDLRAWDANGRALALTVVALSGAFRFTVDVDGAAWPVTVDPIWADWTWTVGCRQREFLGSGVITPDLNADGWPEVVTANPAGTATLTSEGLAMVYAGGPGGPATTPTVVWAGGVASQYLGRALSRGDYNDDGIEDAAIAAADSVKVWFGSAGALPTAPGFTWSHPPVGFASQTLATGDVTGDGIDDIVEGVTGLRGVGSVVNVIAGGVAPTLVWSWPAAGEALAVGDVTGDGWNDLVVGVPGTVFVFGGSAAGLSAAPIFTLAESTPGWSLTGDVGVADLNGDGRDEIYAAADDRVSAPWGEFTGRVEVFDNTATPVAIWATGLWTPSTFHRVDADGDGHEDLLIGDPMDRMEIWARYDDGSGNQYPDFDTSHGQLQLFLGGTVLPTAPDRTWSDPSTDRLGYELDVADIDQDGTLDAVSAAPTHDCSHGQPGVVQAIPLAVDPGVLRGLVATGTTVGHVGEGVAAGDLDGDGYDDLLVGASGDPERAGGAFVLRGSPAGLGAPEPFSQWTGDQLSEGWTAVADMDGDGRAEAIVLARDAVTNTYVAQRWQVPVGGSPTLLGSFVSDGPLYTAPRVADLNDDGREELIVKTGGHHVRVMALAPGGGIVTWSPAEPSVRGWTVLDYDGDGVDDLALGSAACGAPPVGIRNDTGVRCVHIWRGQVGMPAAAPTWELFSIHNSTRFAEVLESGPIDAAPGDDLLVGGTQWDHADLGYFSGGSTTWARDVAPNLLDSTRTPVVVADFTGDGHADLVVASRYPYAWKRTEEKHMWMLPGGPLGLSGQPSWSPDEGVGPMAGDTFYALALAAGDFNGDGTADLAVGAPDRAFLEDIGGVYALYGSAAGLSYDLPATDADGDGLAGVADCDDQQAAVGGPAPMWGDIDGDGFGEVEVLTCATRGMVAQGGDCNAFARMAQADVGAGVDSDCDGDVQCIIDRDQDGDGDGTLAYIASADADCTDPGEQRWQYNDCDDTNPGRASILPDAIGDGVDSDCDNLETCWSDGDGDGFAAETTTIANDADCADRGEAPPGAQPDCNDADPAVATPGPEVVGDGVDQDCDGAEQCFVDADRDGSAEAGTLRSADTDCLDRYEAGAGAPADLCVGDQRTGDGDGDGLCTNLDSCPTAVGVDGDIDGVCSADLCVGDDALGDSDSDGWCDGVDFRLTPVTVTPGATLNLTVTGARPRARVWWFVSTAGAGNGPCVPAVGLCLDIVTPIQIGDLRADAQGRASLSLTVPDTLPTGLPVVLQAAWIGGGTAAASNVWATTTTP